MLTFEVNIVLVRDREEIIALVAFDRSDIGSVGFAKGDLDAARKKKKRKKEVNAPPPVSVRLCWS